MRRLRMNATISFVYNGIKRLQWKQYNGPYVALYFAWPSCSDTQTVTHSFKCVIVHVRLNLVLSLSMYCNYFANNIYLTMKY